MQLATEIKVLTKLAQKTQGHYARYSELIHVQSKKIHRVF